MGDARADRGRSWRWNARRVLPPPDRPEPVIPRHVSPERICGVGPRPPRLRRCQGRATVHHRAGCLPVERGSMVPGAARQLHRGDPPRPLDGSHGRHRDGCNGPTRLSRRALHIGSRRAVPSGAPVSGATSRRRCAAPGARGGVVGGPNAVPRRHAGSSRSTAGPRKRSRPAREQAVAIDGSQPRSRVPGSGAHRARRPRAMVARWPSRTRRTRRVVHLRPLGDHGGTTPRCPQRRARIRCSGVSPCACSHSPRTAFCRGITTTLPVSFGDVVGPTRDTRSRRAPPESLAHFSHHARPHQPDGTTLTAPCLPVSPHRTWSPFR